MVSVYRRYSGRTGIDNKIRKFVDSREGRMEILQQDAKVILNLNGTVVGMAVILSW
jgi:hypothetical protein